MVSYKISVSSISQHCTTHWTGNLNKRKFHNSRPQENYLPKAHTKQHSPNLCVTHCSFNLLTPVRNTHVETHNHTQKAKKPPPENQLQRGTFSVDKVVLAGIKLNTAWAEQLLAVIIKPFRRHSKGSSALTALIDGLMKSPTIFLAVTKGGYLVCTHQINLRVKY